MNVLRTMARAGPQYRLLAALSTAAVALAVLVQDSGAGILPRFGGALRPLPVALLLALLGFALLARLHARHGFAIYRRENLPGLLPATGVAAALALVMIALDHRIGFPADINVPLPLALAFYPAVGFFAEMLFHVLPLAALLAVLGAIFRTVRHEDLVRLCIPLVALAEPVYQVLWMLASGPYAPWAVAVVGLHVYLINLLQLLLFRRRDFVAMYSFRLAYYLFWHVGWGHLRLHVLF